MIYQCKTKNCKLITAKSIRGIGQRLLNKSMVPDEPIDINDYTTGEFVMRVRYNPDKDVWERYVEGEFIREEVKKERILMPGASIWVTLPATYLQGRVWPEHQAEVFVQSHYVEVETESEERYVEPNWRTIPNTKGLVKQYTPAEKLRMIKEQE